MSPLFEKEYEASAKGAAAKVHFLQENPLGYVMVSLLGGAYLGFGILLTYAIESYLGPQPSAHIVMGISFGVALSLVMLAPHPDTVNLTNYFYNLVSVTADNVAGAIFFVSLPYDLASRRRP